MQAKTALLDRVETARKAAELRMVHNANILETERHVRFAKRMDSAINQIIVHTVISIATLGMAAAAEAVMAASYVAEGAYATAHGVRYAAAAQAWETAVSTGSVLQRLGQASRVLMNPATRGILIEYQVVTYMVQAPAWCIDYTLQEWAKQKQGSEYEWEVPESPESDGGTFLRDEKGKSRLGRSEAWEFLKLSKAVYDAWGKAEGDERKFLTDMSARAERYYRDAVESGLQPLAQANQHLLGMNGRAFAKLDDELDRKIDEALVKNEPKASADERRLIAAEILRSYWMGPYGELAQRSMNLQIEIARLGGEVAAKTRALGAALRKARGAGGTGSTRYAPGPDASVR